jgi:hypothetical protein
MDTFLSGPSGPESGVVSQMNKNSAEKFSVFDHGTSPTARGIQLLLSLPGKFDPLFPILGFYTAIHLSVNQSKRPLPDLLVSSLFSKSIG